MKVITLGTSAGRPTPLRMASACALEYEGEVLLFDCGEGAQTQLAKSSLHWGNLSAIFITHLHGDHVNGLPGLLGTFSMGDREAPLKIFGPRGIKKYLQVLQELRCLWVRFPLEIVEIREPGIIWEEKKFQVETASLDHIIECWGYAFREKNRPGHFDEEKAKKMNIPFGPLRSHLVKGEKIILENGQVILPEEIVGPPRPGRSMAYCLDTRPCAGDLELAYEVDLLVHEATFEESLRQEIATWGHSTTGQAAEVARQAKVKQLVLTHISPRYAEGKSLLHEAKSIFKQTDMAFDLKEFEVLAK